MVVLPTAGLGNHTPAPGPSWPFPTPWSPPLLRWVSRGHGVSHGVCAGDSGGLTGEQVWGKAGGGHQEAINCTGRKVNA